MLDELERVRGYRADEPGPSDATMMTARAELLEAIRQQPQRPPTERAKLRRAQRRRRIMLAGGLAAAGLLAAGVVGLDTDSAVTPPSALAAEMNQLAQVAASQSWTGIPGPGQYLYTESDSAYDTFANANSCIISYSVHRQSWIATNGSGAIDNSASDFRFTSAADQAQCTAAGVTDPSDAIGHGGGSRFPAGGLSFPTNDWKSLSTDPTTLLRQIHEKDGGPDTPSEWFTNVADFMRESDVPPVIRTALYEATALIPGVRSLGVQTTHDGQTGLAVAFYANGQPTHELIFDQLTGRMLGEMYYDQHGKLTDWADYLEQKIVDTLPNYPLNPSSPSGSSGTASDTGTTPGTGTTTAATEPTATPQG